MLNLKSLHPEIHDEFTAGHFTVSKTGRKFSSISIDQAHEQLNALIKGDGGAIGLTDNDSALTRWTTAGPEVVRILQEFEGSVISATDDCQQHEQQHSFQRRFQADVDCLVHTLRDESPFGCLKDREIRVLGSHSLADSSVAESISAAAETGHNQVTKFVDERLKGSTSIFEPLP